MADKNRKKYMKRITIKNGLTEKIIVYYNNFMSCNNIDKNIRQFNNTEESVEKEKRFQELFPTIKSPTEIECMEILNSICKKPALSNAPSHELEWFKRLIHMVEYIPVCITISSAKKEYFGFPLVYVNKQFEKTTEYDREDIIGQNCKFLQPELPIPEEIPQHTLLCKPLQEGVSTSIIITNVKKSGELFYNLFTLKPVFDTDGNYVYCIGVQTEITNITISQKNAQNIIDVLNILCIM
jgi:PAS domain S-box-containing protein